MLAWCREHRPRLSLTLTCVISWPLGDKKGRSITHRRKSKGGWSNLEWHSSPIPRLFRELCSPSQPLRISPQETGTLTPIRTQRTLPLAQGQKPGRPVYRTVPATEKPHSSTGDKNRSPFGSAWSRAPWVILLLGKQKGSFVQSTWTAGIKSSFSSSEMVEARR